MSYEFMSYLCYKVPIHVFFHHMFTSQGRNSVNSFFYILSRNRHSNIYEETKILKELSLPSGALYTELHINVHLVTQDKFLKAKALSQKLCAFKYQKIFPNNPPEKLHKT